MSAANDPASIVIRETATGWAARLAAPDLSHADKVAFAAWLRTSPVHIREYLNVEAVRLTVKAALRGNTTDVRELLRDTSSNVIEAPVSRVSRKPPHNAGTGAFKRAPLAIAATAVLALGVTLALLIPKAFERDSYATAIGEIRRIALPDGSTVELNTHSEIRIDFKANRRDIHLAQGEAFFTVAKHPGRPFRVFSDRAQIRAIGTQFSVYRKPDRTVVTVVEGKVTASSDGSNNPGNPGVSTILTAGQQAVIEPQSSRQTHPLEAVNVNATRVTSWRQQRLIFDNQPLSEVIAEFNRYNRQQLLVEDPGLAAQVISGVFDPDKPQGLVLFLNKKGGAQATERPDGALVLMRLQ